MVTVVVYWIAASYVIGIGLVVDQLRRPLPEWDAAGRNRRFWVSLSLVLGFHGLGQYAAAGYLAGVLPRFHRASQTAPRRPLERLGNTVARRWNSAPSVSRGRSLGATEQLALVAAMVVFASSFIHSVVIADHFEEYWLEGVFFAVVTCLQAVWTVLIYGDPLNRRLLVAGLVGNAALVVMFMITRTVGLPFGPEPWDPEPPDAASVLATLDELTAVLLLAVVLAALGGRRRPSISQTHLRAAAMLAGPLFIYSFMAAFGGHTPH